ncbi:MAG: asparagine synthase (glutamine-hydrolyzing) [Phycisphaerae bacterium]|nr:asparagine synthase (glutamine-hydrolyzing) [Phycisphaerae bacterium]
MCGIAGFIDLKASSTSDELTSIVTDMTDRIAHRGPDGEGYWVDPQSGVALGHRRLSIIDLSEHGAQPMVSSSGRFVLTYNGEVYNFEELRKKLADHGMKFRGHSDTEIILAAIETWGLERAVGQFVGMFAFGLWDREERSLSLVRDRLGIKPLYYSVTENTFLFASELKAFRGHPHWKQGINRNALAAFMRHNYVPGPYSIFEKTFKLQPASILKVPLDSVLTEVDPDKSPVEYWSAKEVYAKGQKEPFSGTLEEATDSLEEELGLAVERRMIADVPLGAFLSGGIDSSVVVALMQAQSTKPIRSFSIGFTEESHDEAKFAKAVARHLGTDHTELYVTGKEALDVIPKLPYLYDEPFADSSQIPTYLLSALTRGHVTVSLSGDGGDELFLGYMRYAAAEANWSKLSRIPRVIRHSLGKIGRLISPEQWDAILEPLARKMPAKLSIRARGDEIHRISGLLLSDEFAIVYQDNVSHWKLPGRLVIGSSEPLNRIIDLSVYETVDPLQRQMALVDLLTYLPDDILVKVDRASMGVGLEARVPIIDHNVVEFVATLPQSYLVEAGSSKRVLQELLFRYVPRFLVERPKMGFGVPLGDWLRGPLRDWAEHLLDPAAIVEDGILNRDMVAQIWKDHIACQRDRSSYLWDVLMFQAWKDTYL